MKINTQIDRNYTNSSLILYYLFHMLLKSDDGMNEYIRAHYGIMLVLFYLFI